MRPVFYGFLVGLSISTIFSIKHIGYAQMPDSESVPSKSAPSTKAPIGTKIGLDELAALLDASEPTNAKPIRRVVISLPDDMPEIHRLQTAGNTAIREFFLIAGESLKSDDRTPKIVPDLTAPQGWRGMLPNGGTITLRLRKENNGKQQRTVGELRLKDHHISGYEDINQIEFVAE